MTARVLVVDDILANIKLLEARLQAEYFEVLTATSGQDALDICDHEQADVILLDVMMPGMDGFEVCRRLKANHKTQHIPVVMVTALDQTSDRVQGLQAGADDFLTKPVDEIALITRVRNLARVKMLNDEMMMRAASGQNLALSGESGVEASDDGLGGKILLVDDDPRLGPRLADTLGVDHDVQIQPDLHAALLQATEGDFDALMISLSLKDADGLRLCSQIRSIDRTRHLPIILLVDPGDEARLLRGLDMGINDYLIRPIDRHEVQARMRTQIKRKRFSQSLRSQIEQRVELAVVDPLTGLNNRRFLESHMSSQVREALERGKPMSLLIIDVDHFKNVNDTYGHDSGDMVLKEFAARLRHNVRGIDLACRYGGEEFVVVMPDTDLVRASHVAERLRACVADEPFKTSHAGGYISLTASVGVACLERTDDTAEIILKRADVALYAAKRAGRNRVIADAA
ncbi:MAG: PleD family two-component system response regulator [Hyphomicrobiaceae bacterium]